MLSGMIALTLRLWGSGATYAVPQLAWTWHTLPWWAAEEIQGHTEAQSEGVQYRSEGTWDISMTDHRGVRCAKLRCNISSHNESRSWRRSYPYVKQAGDRQLAALIVSRVAASVLLGLVSTYSHRRTHPHPWPEIRRVDGSVHHHHHHALHLRFIEKRVVDFLLMIG